ncbi:ead/Ea22-like family protein [Salmonella enterica subsp. enterica serovar Braenderup]|nr:ead/Ea22-like family protein [Salmonella enterica subsp. enterica serovar Braenderup]ECD3088239.1 ead/Ea22-like family protein [Salmonella enterica subsp. enterica serovar Braenderup]
MSNIDKHALREAAIRAGSGKWIYIRTLSLSKTCITEETGATVINCTDGDVPAKCAGFLTSASHATVLALLDELEAKDRQNALDVQIKARLCRESNSLHDRLREAEKRIAEQQGIILSACQFISKYAVSGDAGADEFVMLIDRVSGHR